MGLWGGETVPPRGHLCHSPLTHPELRAGGRRYDGPGPQHPHHFTRLKEDLGGEEAALVSRGNPHRSPPPTAGINDTIEDRETLCWSPLETDQPKGGDSRVDVGAWHWEASP